MSLSSWTLFIVPTLILAGALVTDLRSRKIYNWYIVPCAVLALAHSFYFFGLPGIWQGLAGAGLALLISLPLVLVGVLGGGDMKLFTVFGLATSASTIFSVMVTSFIWAAIFGIIYSIVSGSFKKLVTNMGALSTGGKPSQLELHKIPFTLPIAIGWLTHIIQLKGGL